MEDDSAHSQTLSEMADYIRIFKRKEWGFTCVKLFFAAATQLVKIREFASCCKVL